jgi:excisionase family DNA binding protein
MVIERIAKEGRFEVAYKIFDIYLKHIARFSNVSSLSLRSKLVGGLLQESVQARTSMKMIPTALKRRKRLGLDFTFGFIHERTAPEVSIDATSDEAEEKSTYYSTFDAAEKLGVTAQTVRRMCEYGKFPGAIRTDGGHWRIPQIQFKTTKEQDQRAEAALRHLELNDILLLEKRFG